MSTVQHCSVSPSAGGQLSVLVSIRLVRRIRDEIAVTQRYTSGQLLRDQHVKRQGSKGPPLSGKECQVQARRRWGARPSPLTDSVMTAYQKDTDDEVWEKDIRRAAWHQQRLRSLSKCQKHQKWREVSKSALLEANFPEVEGP